MNQQQFQKMYKLHEKAKRLEKYAKDKDALDIYLQIHKEYFPNTSDLYERPIILLEKNHRYHEALEICKLAIERIEAQKISGSLKFFNSKLEHLENKLSSTKNNRTFQKKNLFNPITWAIQDWLISLCIMILLLLLYYFAPDNSKFEDIEVTTPISEENNLENLYIDTEDNDNSYKITEDMIKTAQNMINSEIEVTGSGIIVENKRIGFALFITKTVSKNTAKQYAINFIKSLAKVASDTYTELSAPNAINIGDLYKFYDCYISVGIDADHILVRGDKSIHQSTIIWHD